MFKYFLWEKECPNHRRSIKTEEKAKVVAVGYGDVLECRTNHLAAKMIWTKVFGRTSILVGCEILVWCEPDDLQFFFFKASFPSSSH